MRGGGGEQKNIHPWGIVIASGVIRVELGVVLKDPRLVNEPGVVKEELGFVKKEPWGCFVGTVLDNKQVVVAV